MVLGGPTAVIDIGGLRIVTDPAFDAAGPHGYLTKTAGPAVGADELGPVDLVLVSHDLHLDNLDEHGRASALAAPLVLTGPRSASRLGSPAVGLSLWTSHALPRADGNGDLTVLAVPAVHGPEDGERAADGNVNCEVTGFVLSGQDLPTVYVSDDNASIRTVAEISHRVPDIGAAVLNAGAARWLSAKRTNRTRDQAGTAQNTCRPPPASPQSMTSISPGVQSAGRRPRWCPRRQAFFVAATRRRELRAEPA
ncbi:MBL fold metallo-hydrolase [Streptosporangium album]